MLCLVFVKFLPHSLFYLLATQTLFACDVKYGPIACAAMQLLTDSVNNASTGHIKLHEVIITINF